MAVQPRRSIMPKPICISPDPGNANADDLHDNLSLFGRLSVGHARSAGSVTALKRVYRERIDAQERIEIFAIHAARDATLGTLAANSITMMGAVEARLATNANAALDSLGAVRTAGLVGAFESRRASAREIGGLVERGSLTQKEAEDLFEDIEEQLLIRKDDIRDLHDASRERMRTIIAAGGTKRKV
jgi:polyhydroxyalkanoate synthesis regulator phasin